jgi:2-(3-amino-3-carboxypropyl)histidine synthase
MKILLQFPEGLKQHALKHAKALEKERNEVFVSATPSFGACDLAIEEAKAIGADKLVHFGHNEFKKANFNVEYVPYEIDADMSILDNSLDMLKEYKKIGIVTTVQHLHQLGQVKEFYSRNGKEIFIGKPYGFAKAHGQILGCDVGSASTIDSIVECFVYFGGGLFHPLGAVYGTTKPFLSIDPFIKKMEWLDRYREIHSKASKGKIMRSIDARKFGILVSTKTGQHNMNLAKMLKNIIESNGNDAAILIGDTFDFYSLDNMLEFDAFVSTACPRIATDDIDRVRKPLMNANEVLELMKIRKQE